MEASGAVAHAGAQCSFARPRRAGILNIKHACPTRNQSQTAYIIFSLQRNAEHKAARWRNSPWCCHFPKPHIHNGHTPNGPVDNVDRKADMVIFERMGGQGHAFDEQRRKQQQQQQQQKQ
ncbi:hypothetical protein T4C_11675 [Trichinella pseudospiralis]|uniref:Uncharacterized protein n=1 Tax=Trichinella pseudospiralis TaxID=6337 RepID=A0A0V1JM27_TRIPS|nr:hypothetical protein T4C_11675 [Trichinella pseudospiralis]